jgi:hypothetical protein
MASINKVILQNRTAGDIYRLALMGPFIRSSGRPFIKHVNWPTGFGKTHMAASFAVQLFGDADAIPVFLAPQQTLVSDFASHLERRTGETGYDDAIEAAVAKVGRNVPVYRICSQEFHFSDRGFFESAISLAKWVRANAQTQEQIARLQGSGDTEVLMREQAEAIKHATVCLTSEHHGIGRNDEEYERLKEAYDKSAGIVLTRATSLMRKLIRVDHKQRTQSGPGDRRLLLETPQVQDMCRRLFPLQCFLDRPGIIVTTSAKATTQFQVYMTDPVSETAKFVPFDSLFHVIEAMNDDESPLGRAASWRPGRLPSKRGARVVLFVDEEEDSYWQTFSQRMSILNRGGYNDLNRVIKEFVDFFDISWPAGLMSDFDPGLGPKVLERLEDITEIADEVFRWIEQEKASSGIKFMPESRRQQIFIEQFRRRYPEHSPRWSDAELVAVYKNLIEEGGDAHADFTRLRQKGAVMTRFREFLSKELPDAMGTTFDRYRHVMALVGDKKYFLMDRIAYGEVLDQPHQTFFTESGSVMSTDFLRRVELIPATGRQVVRLKFHEEAPPAAAFTLEHYLRLVLFIAGVLTDSKQVAGMSKEDRSKYPKLAHFKDEAAALFKPRDAAQAIDEMLDSDKLLDEPFFYGILKSVVTLEESFLQAEEYRRDADICLTVTITSLNRTPEDDIARALGTRNGVYLLSATGAIRGSSTGAYNMRELERIIERKDGLHLPMTEEETAVVKEQSRQLGMLRERRATIFDDHNILESALTSEGFRGLVGIFEEQLKDVEDEFVSVPNVYKIQEISGLLATLDRLLATPARSGLALCQTTKRMREALTKLAKMGGRAGSLGESFVTAVDGPGGNIYRIDPRHLPTYKAHGQKDPITLVLYEAGRFRKTSADKVGFDADTEDPGAFNDELNRALDLSAGGKILLWSAFGSAARGVNFLTTDKGVQRDFEVFAIVNDPYFTKHTRTGQRGFIMQTFQSYAQVIYDNDETWRNSSLRDFLAGYARRRWPTLQREHFIDITRTLFQAIGRGERRAKESMERPQEIMLSAGAARSLTLGIRQAPDLVERASAAQRFVLEALQARNAAEQIFPNEVARREHERDCLVRAVGFREFSKSIPSRMRRDPAAIKLWKQLFDPIMFSRPEDYIERLQSADIPEDFWGAAFLKVPQRSTLYLKTVTANGHQVKVITDAHDGQEAYEWAAMLAPQGMFNMMSAAARSFIRAFRSGVTCEPDDDGRLMRLVPQPWFLVEIMKGYLGEIEFEAFMKDHVQGSMAPAGDLFATEPVLKLMRTEDLPEDTEAKLFQLFDYYFEGQAADGKAGDLVAVDVKHWTVQSDQMLGAELRDTAEAKFAKLRELYPDRHLRVLYVNLEGNQKVTGSKVHNGEMRFASIFVRTEARGFKPWEVNTRLAEMMTGGL